MRLNSAGEMVSDVWNAIPSYYYGIGVDRFVVMPDHVHGIIIIHDVRATPIHRSMSLSDVMHRFKSLTTARYIAGVKEKGWPAFNGRLWQRNYYERIIREGREHSSIREYIVNNPANDEYKKLWGILVLFNCRGGPCPPCE